jgi:hypothetical protein
MYSGGLSPCSQEAVIGPYPERDETVSHPPEPYIWNTCEQPIILQSVVCVF